MAGPGMAGRMVVDVSQQPPPESYRYYDIAGLPFAGDPGILSQAEYQSRTRQTVRVGYGNFDTAIPSQRHFGRTLNEVLGCTMTSEYRILIHREQWVTCEKFGVRIMYFVQWAEYSDRFNNDAMMATTSRVSGMQNSR